MKLLIIRPQPGADATARRVRAAGLTPLIMPLFAAEPVPVPVSVAVAVAANPHEPPYDALLLTSAQAAAHAAPIMADIGHLPVYAVGPETANAARAAGFRVAAQGSADAGAATYIAAQHGRRRLLWLTGADHIAPPPHANLRIDPVIVYRAAALDTPPDFDDIVRAAAWVLLHSPRAARHFRAICTERKCAIDAVSIAAFSPNIAKAAGTGWRRIIAAPQPNDAALIAAIGPAA